MTWIAVEFIINCFMFMYLLREIQTLRSDTGAGFKSADSRQNKVYDYLVYDPNTDSFRRDEYK